MIVVRPNEDQRATPTRARCTIAGGVEGDNWVARGSRHTADGSANPDQQITMMNARYLDLVAGSRERWPLAGDQLIVDLTCRRTRLSPATACGSARWSWRSPRIRTLAATSFVTVSGWMPCATPTRHWAVGITCGASTSGSWPRARSASGTRSSERSTDPAPPTVAPGGSVSPRSRVARRHRPSGHRPGPPGPPSGPTGQRRREVEPPQRRGTGWCPPSARIPSRCAGP
jgi:hypothetical protein